MKKNTKQRILDAALSVFNERGYANVRLADIATRTGEGGSAQMSVGNMAYHFKHKQDMLLAISQQIRAHQESLLDEIQLTPLFENFEVFLFKTFSLQRRYQFFYTDMVDLVRTSEELASWIKEHIQWKEMQLELVLQMHEARGAMAWHAGAEGCYQCVTSLRRSMDSWHAMQIAEGGGLDAYEQYRRDIWQVLAPFFTEIGRREFDAIPMLLKTQSLISQA